MILSNMSDGNESDALALEKVEFDKWMNEAIAEAERQIATLQRQAAAQGAYNSGRRHLVEMEIRFSNLAEAAVQKAIAKRRELGRRVPVLLAQNQLQQLRDRLHQHVDAVIKGQQTRMSMGGFGGVSASLNQQIQMKGVALKGRVSQDLAALHLEAKIGMHEEPKAMTIINISESTIAALNLGTVVGDLNASIQTLNKHGQGKLAGLIQRLTEAIAGSTEVQDAARKELLEHVSFVSTEAALPPEKRKMAPLKSSLAFLRETLTTVSQLAALWPPIERVLKATGILT